MSNIKDPTDEREIGTRDIHEETVCCEDGACNWRDNTPAQSEGKVKTGDKGGGREKGGPREWTDDQVTNPPQGHSRDPPVVLKRHVTV